VLLFVCISVICTTTGGFLPLFAGQILRKCRFFFVMSLFEGAVLQANPTKEGRVLSSMSIKAIHSGCIAIIRAKVCNHTAKALIAVQRF
jgi:hypothetical protein